MCHVFCDKITMEEESRQDGKRDNKDDKIHMKEEGKIKMTDVVKE